MMMNAFRIANVRRLKVIAAALAAAGALGLTPFAAGQVPENRSLAEVYKNDFLIGMAIDFQSENSLSNDEDAVLKRHFNILTPENSMKPQSVHPTENRWTWETADRLVQYCQNNGMQVWGHTLVWHAQTPPWFFEGENGQPVTREKAAERLRAHIHAVVGRYKGKIKGWDVVNEAISDGTNGEGEGLRESPWFKALGPEYLTLAFKFAREADPDCELYYNDYNIESGNKHKSSLALLKRLIKDGAPISGVGIQGHWGLRHMPFEDIDRAISDYKALGLKVSITELDVTINTTGGGQLTPPPGGQLNPPGNGQAGPSTRPATRRGPNAPRGPVLPPTPEQIKAQAEAYSKFFQLFLKHSDVIERVTVWGLNDARSWRRGQAPLLFDNDNKPKPALQAVLNAKSAGK
jgi:GH35 family endo-1,4-beta-xylanase